MKRDHIRLVQTLAGLVIALISFVVPGWAATPGQKVLYAFQAGNDGADPLSSLIFDSSGNLTVQPQMAAEGRMPEPCSS
jgi:hypothetical protein